MGETELLIGGVADGYAVPKTDSPHMYAGRYGDGRVRVYLRREDGRLHFSHEFKAPKRNPHVRRIELTSRATTYSTAITFAE